MEGNRNEEQEKGAEIRAILSFRDRSVCKMEVAIMAEMGRRDFCIECRKETEYFLQKKDIVKTIKDKEYTCGITVAVCAV